MPVDSAAGRLRAALADRRVPLPADELDEMLAAQPALAGWIDTVERVAAEWPAFAAPLTE